MSRVCSILLFVCLLYVSPALSFYLYTNALKKTERFTFKSHDDVSFSTPISQKEIMANKLKRVGSLISALGVISSFPAITKSDNSTQILARSDVGFIDLNTTEPEVTDICWLDVQIGDSSPQRLEISLYGTVTPITANNFKSLCLKDNKLGIGYEGSEIFRVITTFSVQGGNIGNPVDGALSKAGRYGMAATGESFAPENYRILHSYEKAGVISMMKDKGLQDSRFFITTSPYASWADERYVAFGRVSKGMDYVNGMSIIPTEPPSNYPQTKIKIVGAGCYEKK